MWWRGSGCCHTAEEKLSLNLRCCSAELLWRSGIPQRSKEIRLSSGLDLTLNRGVCGCSFLWFCWSMCFVCWCFCVDVFPLLPSPPEITYMTRFSVLYSFISCFLVEEHVYRIWLFKAKASLQGPPPHGLLNTQNSADKHNETRKCILISKIKLPWA